MPSFVPHPSFTKLLSDSALTKRFFPGFGPEDQPAPDHPLLAGPLPQPQFAPPAREKAAEQTKKKKRKMRGKKRFDHCCSSPLAQPT